MALSDPLFLVAGASETAEGHIWRCGVAFRSQLRDYKLSLDPVTGRTYMEDLAQPILDFVAAHHNWSLAIMFLMAFGESLAFISWLVPGTALLIAAGTLLPAGTLPYVPVLVGAIAGAVLGDSVSYWIGRRFGSLPDLTPRAILPRVLFPFRLTTPSTARRSGSG